MKQESSQEKLRAKLRQGGANLFRRGSSATIYSVHGPDRERETAAGGTTLVSQLLSPKLKLTVRQRATGQCFGAYVERSHTGGGSEFLKVFVDTGRSGGGGHSEAQAMVIRAADVAYGALEGLPAFTYPIGKHRGDGSRGVHKPIPARYVAEAVCVAGWTLDAVALTQGWWVERRDGSGRWQRVVPDRQRKAVAEALRVTLDAIDAAWDAWGFSPPYEFGGVEVE